MNLTERELELLRAAPYPNETSVPQEIRSVYWGLMRKGLIENKELDAQFNWHFIRTAAGDELIEQSV